MENLVIVGVEWIVCGGSSYSSSCDDNEMDGWMDGWIYDG